MPKRLLLLFVFLLIPTVTFAQNDSREFTAYGWYDDGIRFSYPLSVAGDAGANFTPASADTPEMVRITFSNYLLTRGWEQTGAEINVMLASTLPPAMSDLLNGLGNTDEVDIRNQLQVLGLVDDTSVTVAQTVPLVFHTGSGVRFITATADETDSTSLSYGFLGKTADDNYLITAVFPLSSDMTSLDAQALEALAESDFSPGLDALDTLIRSLSVTPPQAMLPTTQTGGTVDYEGIHFTYDPSLAYRIEVDSVAPIIEAEPENTMFGDQPGYTKFTFVGFPAIGRFQFPQIFVMPVSEFPDEAQIYGTRLAELKDLLAGRPELTANADPSALERPLPILPILNAAQTIVSKPEYLSFVNGEGVRYVTYYSQEASPIAADDLFYTFAGISDDGQYVVAATFPLFAGFLPQGRTIYEVADWERFYMNYRTYLDGLLLQIDVMESSAYTPHLELLDALMISVTVE